VRRSSGGGFPVYVQRRRTLRAPTMACLHRKHPVAGTPRRRHLLCCALKRACRSEYFLWEACRSNEVRSALQTFRPGELTLQENEISP
jgi:hypothetical protein